MHAVPWTCNNGIKLTCTPQGNLCTEFLKFMVLLNLLHDELNLEKMAKNE